MHLVNRGVKMSDSHRVVIIGAGPAGLGAAVHLRDLGQQDALILEASDDVGGLAGSFRDQQGFTWDLGSHLCYSHYDKVDRCWEAALRPDEWLKHQRSTWVWVCDRFVPYPFQLNLHRLQETIQDSCLQGLIRAARGCGRDIGSFRDWVLATFGSGIAEHFMLPYNAKLWRYPLERMSSQWIRERVAVPDVEEVLRRIRLREDSKSWGPNAEFRYPRRGGSGAVWTALAATLPPESIRYGERVVRIDADQRVVHTGSGATYGYDYLISTMPVDQLAMILNTSRPCPPTEGLAATTVHVIGVGCEGQPPESLQDKLWIYYPDHTVPFYRVTVLSNLSDENTPRPGQTWSLMAEVSESPHWPLPPGARVPIQESGSISEILTYVGPFANRLLIQKVIDGLRAVGILRHDERIVSRWHRTLEYGYPVPTLDRDAILSDLLPLLRELGIYSRGRFGAWKYEVGNQDHSFMQGAEAVEHILHGHRELTVENPDLVNSRQNPFPYGEWSAAQESGPTLASAVSETYRCSGQSSDRH
jgi:protoporphyrinogen oxidase